MRKILHLTCVHGGAGEAAALLQYEDGVARGGLAVWTAGKAWGIVKVSVMTANALGVRIVRGGHQGDDVTIPCCGDTLADFEQSVDLKDLLDGAGIDVRANEVLNFVSIAGAACTTSIVIELEDNCPRVNVRGLRVAGAAAAVADVPTETGANIRAGLSNDGTYKLKAMLFTSTTIQKVMLRWTKQGEVTNQCIDGSPALAAGAQFRKLKTPLRGTGATFGTDFFAEILATAADAAAVQDIFALFETN